MCEGMKTITMPSYSEMRERLAGLDHMVPNSLELCLRRLSGRRLTGYALATSLEIAYLREVCKTRFFSRMEVINYTRLHTSMMDVINALVDDEQVRADAFTMVDIFYQEATAKYS